MAQPQSNQNQVTRQYKPAQQYGYTQQHESTRQYVRQGEGGGTHQPHVPEQETPTKEKGVFSEFSVASVIASSLAAITSFALQRQIGLAGSFLGVGVAAAATAIANQVYKGMLSASADKLKSISEQDAQVAADLRAGDTHGAGTGAVGGSYAQGIDPYGSPADRTALRSRPIAYSPEQVAVAESGTPIAPDSLIRAAAERRHALIRKRATISIVVIALVATLLTAGIVFLATAGHGLGRIDPVTTASPRPTPVATTTSTTQQDDNTSPAEGDATTPEGEGGTAADANAPEQNAADTTSPTTETSGNASSAGKADGNGSADSAGAGTGTENTGKPSAGTSGETTGAGGNAAGSQGGNAAGAPSTGGSSGGSTGGEVDGGATGAGGGGSTGASPSAATTTTNKS